MKMKNKKTNRKKGNSLPLKSERKINKKNKIMNILKWIRRKFFGGEPRIEKSEIRKEKVSTPPARNEQIKKRERNKILVIYNGEELEGSNTSLEI